MNDYYAVGKPDAIGFFHRLVVVCSDPNIQDAHPDVPSWMMPNLTPATGLGLVVKSDPWKIAAFIFAALLGAVFLIWSISKFAGKRKDPFLAGL